MRKVIVESPLRGRSDEEYERNRRYARACMRDCLLRGEAPFASHLLYDQPGILNDVDVDERLLGMAAGLAWGEVADYVVVYYDLGYSDGMKFGINRHKMNGTRIEYRELGSEWGSYGK